MAAVEVVLAAIAVFLDLLLPTLVLLTMAGISLLIRRTGFASLGLHPLTQPGRSALQILGIMTAWTALHLVLFMPVLEHAPTPAGCQPVRGVAGQPRTAAVLAHTHLDPGCNRRGAGIPRLPVHPHERDRRWWQRRRDPLGAGLVNALQPHPHRAGAVGVALAFINALLFCALRLHYRTLWASVLAHGFGNSLGMIGFFLLGPIHALW